MLPTPKIQLNFVGKPKKVINLRASSNSVFTGGDLCGNGSKKPQNATPERPISPLAGFSAKPPKIKSLRPQDVEVVLFHAGCMDGKAAAYAAYVCLGNKAEYYPVRYGSKPAYDLLNKKKVILLDFCYDLKSMAKILLMTTGEFLVIDHHKTALKNLKKFPVDHKIFDEEHSSCVLAWKFFNPMLKIPRVFEYIEDRDLWSWTLSNSRAFNFGWRVVCNPHEWTACHSLNFAPFINAIEVGASSREVLRKIIKKGHIVMVFKNNLIQKHVTDSVARRLCKRPQWKCRLVNATMMQSEIAEVLLKRSLRHKLCGKKDSETHGVCCCCCCDVAIVWSLRHSELHLNHQQKTYLNVKLQSFRTEFDVGKLAAEYGGGGHAHHAEFNLFRSEVGGTGIEYLFDMEEEEDEEEEEPEPEQEQ